MKELLLKRRSNKRNQKGLLFDEIDKDGSTKDKQVIADKLNMLETLMFEFLRLLHEENRLSLLAMVAYSYKEDVDLEKWLFRYAQNNQTYLADQRKNFIYMKKDFERLIKHGRG